MMTEEKNPNLLKGSRIDVTFVTPDTERDFSFTTDTMLMEEAIGKMMITMRACIERYVPTIPSNFSYCVKSVTMPLNVLKDMVPINIEDYSEQSGCQGKVTENT